MSRASVREYQLRKMQELAASIAAGEADPLYWLGRAIVERRRQTMNQDEAYARCKAAFGALSKDEATSVGRAVAEGFAKILTALDYQGTADEPRVNAALEAFTETLCLEGFKIGFREGKKTE